MTQYESIEPGKVKEIFAKSFTVDKRTGEIRACNRLDCKNCLFYESNDCMKAKNEWLDQPTFDWDKDIDWEKVPVDTPVLVNLNTGKENRRYFFCKENDDEPTTYRTFANGRTSWTAGEEEYAYWPHCKLYRPEDIEKYRKKDTENG